MTGRDASITAVTDARPEGEPVLHAVQGHAGCADADKVGLRAQAIAVIRDTVQPAYRDLLTFMRTEYLARHAHELAAYDLPDGKSLLPREDPRIHHAR
jgi:uncharacterized protein (DUF885 family)